ncbi:MAG: pantothenate kinase, partial [Rhizobacter sp.]|nr:pantothenate kinase [Chlorobiales bacterium]
PRLKKTSRLIGRSTAECLSSGLYFGAAAQTAGLIDKLKTELRAAHAEKKIYVLATGGDAQLLARAVHFDAIDPDAVLKGIASLAAINP